MTSQTVQIDLTLLLPDMHDGDGCIGLFTSQLAAWKGIAKAHIVRANDVARLCLHYDPNLIELSQVERLAQEAGAAVTSRYRHEQIPFVGLDAADTADTLAASLADLPGMLHAYVNYAAGLILVAYDTTHLQRDTIERTIASLGARVLAPASPGQADATAEKRHIPTHDHSHGTAPAFLPHWMQERWPLILVALAGVFLLIGWVGETFLALPATIAFVFYLLAYVAGGYDVASHAIPALLRGKSDTDGLMLAAATGAAILGEWGDGAFLLFLFALGHAGEHYALDRARNAVNALGGLMPKTAWVKRGADVVETAIEALQIDEVVVVRPGDRLPVDGVVERGQSSVDQSPVTGESVPVVRGPGDTVFAGTINQDGGLEVRMTRLARDNTLSRVMQLVAEAQSQQSQTQQLTQRFTSRFVPAVLIAATLVTLVPPLLGWLPLAQSFYRALLLLVAASPCALAVGTPATVLAGIAQAARNGVLIKGGVHLENLGRVKAIAFDKTGTLTEGRFAVTDVVPLNGASHEEVLSLAAAVEQRSNHPLAQAIVRAAQTHNLPLPTSDGLENVPGQGVRSLVNGQPVRLGSLKLFQTDGVRLDPAVVQRTDALTRQGRTIMAVQYQGAFLGVLGLADTPRPTAYATLQRLRGLGIQHLVMLTGDHADVAQRVGQAIGVTDIRADLMPEDKLQAIQALQTELGPLAMVGDGVNDAPALVAATVGIAMGGAGTAVALETADVALMADDLGKLPFAVGLSRASRAIIYQNLLVSLGVIGLLLVTSVLGMLHLNWAVILHEGSTLVVVLNALRLLGYHDAQRAHS